MPSDGRPSSPASSASSARATTLVSNKGFQRFVKTIASGNLGRGSTVVCCRRTVVLAQIRHRNPHPRACDR